MLSRQCKLVLDHMSTYGYITPLAAYNYGITRLASRVHDLKRANYPITRSTHFDLQGKRYSRYAFAY